MLIVATYFLVTLLILRFRCVVQKESNLNCFSFGNVASEIWSYFETYLNRGISENLILFTGDTCYLMTGTCFKHFLVKKNQLN